MYISELALIHDAVGPAGLDQAITLCIRECDFLPTIAQIRDRAGLNQRKVERSHAQQAWMIMLSWMDEYWTKSREVIDVDENEMPIYEHWPELPDRIWYAVQCAGGMAAIRETRKEDLHFRHSEFLTGYEEYQHAERFPMPLTEELNWLLPDIAPGKVMPPGGNVKSAFQILCERQDAESFLLLKKRRQRLKENMEERERKEAERARIAALDQSSHDTDTETAQPSAATGEHMDPDRFGGEAGAKIQAGSQPYRTRTLEEIEEDKRIVREKYRNQHACSPSATAETTDQA